jgi:hypothetical protein
MSNILNYWTQVEKDKTPSSQFPSVTDRVLIKYPEFQSRELEFLYFKNLEIKVKNHDFEIKKIEEENNIIEFREESCEVCDDKLKRIIKRVKMSKGRIIETSVDEIKDTAFFTIKEAEKVGENVNKLSDAELKNKVEILSDRIPLVGIEKEIKKADVKDAYLLLEKMSVLKACSKECDEISERISAIEKYIEEREKIKKEIEELEKEKKEKEGEAKVVSKEKAEAIKEEIKGIEKRIKEGKIRIKEIEEKRKEEAKKAREDMKELVKKIKKEMENRAEKIIRIEDAIRKIDEGVAAKKKKDEILNEIKDPYVKSLIEKVKDLEINDIKRALKRARDSLIDPNFERILTTIERGDIREIKKQIEEMKRIIKSIEKFDEKLKSGDEIEIRKCIREIYEELPNEFKEIMERIKRRLDELLMKKGKISEKEYAIERDKCLLDIQDEFAKLSDIGKVYSRIVKEIEKEKKLDGKKFIGIIQNALLNLKKWIFGCDGDEEKEIKRCDERLRELYEKERKLLQISDELCAYIKSGKKGDLKRLLKAYDGFKIEGIEIKDFVEDGIDFKTFRKRALSLLNKINLKIKSIEGSKRFLVKKTIFSKYFG